MKKTIAATIIVAALLAGCATPAPAPTPTPTQGVAAPAATTVPPTEPPSATPTDTATSKPTTTPTPEPPKTPTPPSPTPTEQVRQTLGRIFPEGDDGCVWSSLNIGAPDSRTTHFDVCPPPGFVSGQDPVVAPASGRIVEVYWVGEGGEGGQVITIEPDPPLRGVEEMVSSAGLDPSQIWMVYYHLGHITAWKTEGWVEAGEPVGTPFDVPGPDKIAYVIRVGMIAGERQYSPCDLPNIASFCGKCCPDTPEPCP